MLSCDLFLVGAVSNSSRAADLGRGFLVDDTLSVSIVALHLSSKSAQKMPAAGSKRAFALVDQTGTNE